MVYTVLAALVLGVYLVSTASGWEYGHPGREKTTEEAKRQGYRGGHFMFVHGGGARGGK